MEKGDASGTAFFDVRNKYWSKGILKVIDSEKNLSLILPPIIEEDEIAWHQARTKRDTACCL